MRETIRNRIEAWLSQEYACTPEELNGTGTVWSVPPHADRPTLKILAYRRCVLVYASEGLHETLRGLLQGKSRNEIFELPLVYGQTIHYVPDCGCKKSLPRPSGYTYERLFEEGILSLKGLSGFENALAFDASGSTPTKAVSVARDAGKIIGIAGAAGSSSDGVWEVGVDVAEAYRNAGLGAYLVGDLTRELLTRDIIPFYSASVTNIASQRVAHRCGYIPFWVNTFGTVLDGSSVYGGMADSLAAAFSK